MWQLSSVHTPSLAQEVLAAKIFAAMKARRSKQGALVIHSLQPWREHFGDDGAQTIAATVSTDSSVRSLRFCNRDLELRPHDWRVVCQGAGASTSLATMDIFGGHIGDDGAQGLASALAASATLTRLNLCQCWIGPAGCAMLSEGVGASASLTALNLSGTWVGNGGATGLARALGASTTVSSLNLADCKIGPAGGAALADGVMQSSSLKALDMGGNAIGDHGAGGLGKALVVSTSLSSLCLQRCGIGAAGCVELSLGVGKSRSLTALDLSDNMIGDDGARGLGVALASRGWRATINKLQIRRCGIGASGGAELSAGVCRSELPVRLCTKGNSLLSACSQQKRTPLTRAEYARNHARRVLRLCDMQQLLASRTSLKPQHPVTPRSPRPHLWSEKHRAESSQPDHHQSGSAEASDEESCDSALPHVANGPATAAHSHSAQCSASRLHPLCLKRASGKQTSPWNRPTPPADTLRDRCSTMTLAQHHMMELQDIKMRVALSITAALEA